MEPQVTILLKEYNELLSIKEAIESFNEREDVVVLKYQKFDGGYFSGWGYCKKELKEIIEPLQKDNESHASTSYSLYYQNEDLQERCNALEKDYEFLKGKYDELKAHIAKKPWYKFW
jgi:chromosome segregation ATPase